jgi:hypothetical protein
VQRNVSGALPRRKSALRRRYKNSEGSAASIRRQATWQHVRLEKAGKLDNMLNNKTGRAEARN